MKLTPIHILLAIFCFVVVFACERTDDEPPVDNSISRLYISYSNYQPNNDAPKYNNVVLLPYADDSTNMGAVVQTFRSEAQGGNSIYFHPSSQRIFHSSINNSSIDTFMNKLSVGELTGALALEKQIPNQVLKSVKGMVFHPNLDRLYFINVEPNPNVYVFDRPRGLSDDRKPGQTLSFANAAELTPWDLAIVNSNLYMSKSGTDGGIDIYENLISSRDSVRSGLTPARSLRVADASNIRGMSIDTVNNMLALTDFIQSGSGETVSYQGRILLFDNFSSMSETSGTITPSRIITGALTELKQPVDVELDFRKDSKYLYVADPVSKAVFRFLKTDKGNVAPDNVYQYKQERMPDVSTPVSISLDARN